MVDFKSAIKTGLEMATVADRNNKEINSVVTAFSAEVLDLTTGAVEISLGHFMEAFGSIIENPLISSAFRDNGFEGIVAKSRNDKRKTAVLARLKRSAEGYPVEVRFEDQEIAAYDKEGFEQALIKLAVHPGTGKKIFKLQNVPAAPQ